MKRRFTGWLAALLCAALLIVPAGAAGTAQEDRAERPPLKGTLDRLENGALILKDERAQEIVIHLPERTPVVNGRTGEPAQLEDLKQGEALWIYAAPAMTLSLPPQCAAELILTAPAEDVSLVYGTVAAVERVSASAITLMTRAGRTLTVAAETETRPYLTRERVTFRDLIPGVRFLAWLEGNTAKRVLRFAFDGRSFVDVAEDHWAGEDIAACAAEGLLRGSMDLAFRPEEALTRAEMARALYHLAGCPAVEQSAPDFRDLPQDEETAEALTWAVGNGFVNGYGDRTFRPEAPVTRQQLAAVLYRWEQHRGGGFHGAWMFLLDYSDRGEIAEYAYEAVAWCSMNGILSGRADGTLGPGETVTRAASAAMLQRYLTARDGA